MEEVKSRSGVPGDRAQAAAEKLRALRERANQALDEHRQRLGQIESELSARVRQLAEEFETASAGAQRHPANGRDDELAALRQQLEEGRAKHDRFVDQLALARRQLDDIQSQPCVACQEAAQQLAESQVELARLRDQVQAAHQQHEQDADRHAKLAEQIAAARQAIGDLQAETHERTATLQQEVDEERKARTAAEKLAAALARDAEALHAEYDALQCQLDEQQRQGNASIHEQQAAADAALAAQRVERDALRDELETVQRAYAALEARADEVQTRLADAERQTAESARRLEKAEEARAAAKAALAAQQAVAAGTEQAQLQRLAEAQRDAATLRDELAALRSERNALAEVLAASESAQAAAAEKLAESTAATRRTETKLADGEAQRRELQEQLDAARRQIVALEQVGGEVATLKIAAERAETAAAAKTAECSALTLALTEAQSALDELRDATCPREEREQVQRLLDESSDEVRELTAQVAGLRDAIAAQPQHSEQDLQSIAAVTAERDALAARIAELESAAAKTSSHETEDLRRRCELAVDDVRQLKQENSQLRDQLAKAKSTTASGPAAGDANNWAAQRARLMAMLENEADDGPIDAGRSHERASIAEAIEKTDRALAEKDRELAELQASLESRPASGEHRTDPREEILDADETVAAERQRLADLQTEWEQKLRAAELEFAVERAKLAREQSALKERMFDLQKLESQGAAGEAGEAKPRRRWRSALGLGDEGDGKPS